MNDKLLKQITNNLTPLDTEELYANMLDDCYGEVSIAGMNYQTSRALKELDPTAFRCGEVDYIDSLSLVEIGGDYYEQDAVETERDSLLTDLEMEADEFKGDIDQVNDDILDEIYTQEEGEVEIRKIQEKLDALTAEIEKIKEYVF